MISIKNANKFYGKTKVLSNINLDFRKGETVVICGPSGSSKSTLIKTLNGLEPIQSGEITINGKDLKDYKGNELSTTVGMVFQDFALFNNMSVLDNLVKPQMKVLGIAKEQAIDEAMKMLAKVSMESHANKLPDELSGGQKQRVAIARALVMKPQYMLFDEPTSALDPEMVSDVLDVMSALSKEITMIVVTHEMGFAKKFGDRVIFMNQGAVEEDNNTEDFFTKPNTERAVQFLKKIIRD